MLSRKAIFQEDFHLLLSHKISTRIYSQEDEEQDGESPKG